MSDFRWYQDDSICHNCHNHCSLLDPNCEVGKRTAERKQKRNEEIQRMNSDGAGETGGKLH